MIPSRCSLLLPPLRSSSYLFLSRKWEGNFHSWLLPLQPHFGKGSSLQWLPLMLLWLLSNKKLSRSKIVPGREFQVQQRLDCSFGSFAFLVARNPPKEALLAHGSPWVLQGSGLSLLQRQQGLGKSILLGFHFLGPWQIFCHWDFRVPQTCSKIWSAPNS